MSISGGRLLSKARRATGPRRGSWSGLSRKRAIAGYLFLLPNFLGFAVFSVFPIGAALVLTFTDWDLASTPSFNGLANFSTMVKDSLFRQVLGNTVYYTFVAVPTGVLLAFVLALMINRKMWGVLIFRVVYFAPQVTLVVAAALIWQWIYHPEFGLINYLLGLVGIQGPRWCYDSTWAMPAVIIMSNWRGIGYSMLIFLAGLQGIPAELYEAALVDGASPWRQLLHITIPMLSPTTFFVLTTSLIGAFQGFDQFYILTQGGPANSTTTLVMYIFNNGFQYFKMGYAASMAAVLFVIILVITLIQWRLARTWVYGFSDNTS